MPERRRNEPTETRIARRFRLLAKRAAGGQSVASFVRLLHDHGVTDFDEPCFIVRWKHKDPPGVFVIGVARQANGCDRRKADM